MARSPMSRCFESHAIVPICSGTHIKRIVRRRLTLPLSVNLFNVRATSSSAPEPEALSLALNLGWSRWEMRMTSCSGRLLPRKKALVTSS